MWAEGVVRLKFLQCTPSHPLLVTGAALQFDLVNGPRTRAGPFGHSQPWLLMRVSMSHKATILPVAIVVLSGLVGCNKASQQKPSNPESQPISRVDDGKPASQPVPKKPAVGQTSQVTFLRVPNGGIQPQAVVDAKGTLHLIYFKGDKALAGDLFYVRREAGTERFSDPIRVNSQPGSAIAFGTMRGGQITLGKAGRV